MSSELLLVLLQEHSSLGPSEQRGHQLGACKGDTTGVAALRHIQKGRQRESKASGPDVTTSPGSREPWSPAPRPAEPQTVLLVEPGGDRLGVRGILAMRFNQDFICLPSEEDLNLLKTVFS